jgi:RimJ/RimL family protein N-acetyltransferase
MVAPTLAAARRARLSSALLHAGVEHLSRDRKAPAVSLDLDLKVHPDGWRIRTLTAADAPALAEATGGETGRALWGARPVGPYTQDEARAALESWDLARDRQTSYGVFEDDRLVAAVGLMLDDEGGAELAYWVRPEGRRRGIAARALAAVTDRVRRRPELGRLWLEINPDNLGSQGVAARAGYRLSTRLPDHCRSWLSDDPATDHWHDCLIWEFPDAARQPHRG